MPAGYNELLAQVTAAVNPADMLETMFVHDVVNHEWEVRRLRRYKAELLHASAYRGVRTVLTTCLGWQEAKALAEAWRERKPAALNKVDQILAGHGLSTDTAFAETLVIRLAEIERIDRLLTVAEKRKTTALREMDRHRAACAALLRQALEADGDRDDAVTPSGPGWFDPPVSTLGAQEGKGWHYVRRRNDDPNGDELLGWELVPDDPSSSPPAGAPA